MKLTVVKYVAGWQSSAYDEVYIQKWHHSNYVLLNKPTKNTNDRNKNDLLHSEMASLPGNKKA